MEIGCNFILFCSYLTSSSSFRALCHPCWDALSHVGSALAIFVGLLRCSWRTAEKHRLKPEAIQAGRNENFNIKMLLYPLLLHFILLFCFNISFNLYILLSEDRKKNIIMQVGLKNKTEKAREKCGKTHSQEKILGLVVGLHFWKERQ